MKYAWINGIILDGTKDMEPVRGKIVLTEGSWIKDIIADEQVPQGYEIIDLKGQYLMPVQKPLKCSFQGLTLFLTLLQPYSSIS